MKDQINLLEDVAPASNELGAIAEAAQRAQILRDEIDELTKQLKEKEQRLKKEVYLELLMI